MHSGLLGYDLKFTIKLETLRRPRAQKDDRDINETAAQSHQRFWGLNWGGVLIPTIFGSILLQFP